MLPDGTRRSAADRTALAAQSRGRTAGALEAALSASALRDLRPIAAHGAPGQGPHRAAQPPRRGASGPGGSAAPNPDVHGAGTRAGRTAAIAGPGAANAGSGWHEGGGRLRKREDSAEPSRAVRAAGSSAAAAQRDRPARRCPRPREAPPYCACAAPRAAAPPHTARLRVAHAYGSRRASRGVAAFGRTS